MTFKAKTVLAAIFLIATCLFAIEPAAAMPVGKPAVTQTTAGNVVPARYDRHHHDWHRHHRGDRGRHWRHHRWHHHDYWRHHRYWHHRHYHHSGVYYRW